MIKNSVIKRKNTVRKIFSLWIMVTMLSLPNYLLFAENEIRFSHLTAEEGLSANVITSIFQDSKGFMWFGTYNGLNRYDGYSIKVFKPEASNPYSISSYSILDIIEDDNGFIWIATAEGLNKYDWKTESFKRYTKLTDDSTSLLHAYIYCIFKDSENSIWIGNSMGVNKYDRQKDNFISIRISEISYLNSRNAVTSITEDHHGNIWVGSYDGLHCMNKNGEILKTYRNNEDDPKSISSSKILKVFFDNNKNLWIGTLGGGLSKYDYDSESFLHYKNDTEDQYSLSNNYINIIYQDKLKNIWIGTKNGLNKLNPADGKFTRYYNNLSNYFSIINDDILSIEEDKTGIIWFGTSGGVSRFSQTSNKFNYYCRTDQNYGINLSSKRVNSVFIDKKENIWMGTNNGLDVFYKNQNQLVHYKNDPSNSNSLDDNYVKTIFQDYKGIIWIGTDGEGLNRFDPSSGKFTSYKHDYLDENSLSNDGVTVVYEDSKKNLWIGTYYGLNRFNRSSESFIGFYPDFSDSNSLKNGIIWVVHEDSEGMIWFGTDGGGVSRYNPETNSFKTFLYDFSAKTGHRVFSVYESSDGLIWIGTTQGLYRYDRKSDKFNLFTIKNGLPSNAINSIIEDKNGNLWFGSDKGLTRFNKAAAIFQSYSTRNGLKSNEFSINSAVRSGNDLLYFGTSDGLLFFHPDSITDEIVTAPVVFTDFKIYNKSVQISEDGILPESIIDIKEIYIPYGYDVITIEYALLDFYNSRKNKFRYKLEGFDVDWNNVGNRNTATYTNLAPGKYIFHVKASNREGIQNESTASLKIIIVPAYYHTIWFKVSLSLGLFLVTLLYFQVRTRAIKKQNKVLENKVAERTHNLAETIQELNLEISERKKAEQKVQASLKEKDILLTEKVDLLGEKEVLLKEIHHRVKNNLQVISSLLYLNSKKIKDEEVLNMFKDSQNRVKSIALVHERLYQSKDLGKVDFYEYVKKLSNDLFRSYAVNQSVFKLELDIKDIYLDTEIAVPCGLIINELITNSLKYAFPDFREQKKEAVILIEIKRNDNNIILIYKDNGIGMSNDFEEKKKHSLGLQLVETLTAQLEGEIEITSYAGTMFKITFEDNK